MENGTIVIPPYAYKVLGLKHAELIVYGVIYGFTIGKKGRFFGNGKFITEITGFAVETVYRAFKSLTDKGYIKKTVVDTMKNEYHCVPYDELVANGLITLPEKQEKPKRKTKQKTAAKPSNLTVDCETQGDLYQGIDDTKKPQENAKNGDFQLSGDIVDEKPKPPLQKSEVLTPVQITWQAYKNAYLTKYGVEPVRSKKIFGQIKNFVDTVGQDNAPKIVDFYVLNCNNSWYIQKGHDIGTLLTNVQAISRDWQRGMVTTSIDAKQAESSSFYAGQMARAALYYPQGAAEYAKEQEQKNVR